MRVSGLLIASYVVVAPVAAQSRGVEVTYGRWWTDSSAASTYSAALYRPLFGTVSYGIGVVHREDDSLVTVGDIQVLVDPQSAMYLQGATVDWQEGLSGAGFVVRNPNASGSCGCGMSFSV